MLLLAFAGMTLCVAVLPLYIRWVKQFEIKQFLRAEGPKSHLSKEKTPTTGGVCFILSMLLVLGAYWILMHHFDSHGRMVLLAGIACGCIGLVDDLSKVRNKTNAGVSAKLRLVLELVIGSLLAAWIFFSNGDQSIILLPCLKGAQVTAAFVPFAAYVLLGAFLMAATTNAVNLHDGMDGLAAGTTTQVFAVMAVMFVVTGQSSYAVISATIAGALLGFLFFNKHPAQIFMGDTGSLFLGGLMAALVIGGGIVFWFVPLSALFIIETLSVIVQVSYFKLTKPYVPEKPISGIGLLWLKLTKRLPGEGKRLFVMAPLHHHFESVMAEKGISEEQVVIGFWLAQVCICVCVLALFRFL
jgi:phospho-N-acetylmuramoyl-pentapeptide-transferase